MRLINKPDLEPNLEEQRYLTGLEFRSPALFAEVTSILTSTRQKLATATTAEDVQLILLEAHYITEEFFPKYVGEYIHAEGDIHKANSMIMRMIRVTNDRISFAAKKPANKKSVQLS